MSDKPKVLVVDDEVMLADLLAQALGKNGWETKTAHNGMEALREIRNRQPDVVVLDVMMPVMDGNETLARIRQDYPQLPVLMLTARDSVTEKVSALRGGADDYVAKPFDLDEVEARLEVLLRRTGNLTQTPVEEEILHVADLVLNATRHTVFRGEQEVELTKTEFDLCYYLMENVNRVVSKQQILDSVWHFDFGGRANVVELYISYLRRKLDATGPVLIHTVRGVGYVMKPPNF